MSSVRFQFCTLVEVAAAVLLFLGVGLRHPTSVRIHIFIWNILKKFILTGMTRINVVI